MELFGVFLPPSSAKTQLTITADKTKTPNVLIFTSRVMFNLDDFLPVESLDRLLWSTFNGVSLID